MACLLSIGCSRSFRDSWLKKEQGVLKTSSRITQGHLDNGVQYFYLRNRVPEGRCYLRLNVAIGSFAEKDDELGMAHMVEHLAFDDRSISNTESLVEWFQNHGMALGPDANAETYPENTIYKIDLPNCDEPSIQAALGIFRSFAHGLTFRDEAIAKEKNIIDAEEREYSDAQSQLTEKLISYLYSGTSYVSRPVLGDHMVRSSFTKENIISFYKKWYVPKNLSIILVGDFGALNPDDMIKEAFSSLPGKEALPKPKSRKPDHKTPFFALHEKDLAYVETVFTIQAKDFSRPNFSKSVLKDRIAFDLALDMVREAYALSFRDGANKIRRTTIDGTLINNGIFELTLNVASHETDLEEQFLAAFLVLNKAIQHGFDANAFESAKAVYLDLMEQSMVSEMTLGSDVWTSRILDQVDQREVATDAADYHMVVAPILRDLTAKDCQKVLKNALKSGYQYLYAIGAIKEGPETINRLENLLRRAQSAKIDEGVEASNIAFQYSVAECPETHLNEPENLPNLEAKKIQLNNGVELIFKPTNFKKDEVIVEIMTDEGYAHMSEHDLTVARLAKLALMEGGLGKHDPKDLIRITKDKYFSLSLAIFDNRIQATLNTRNRDLKFAIELARAFIIDPQYSESAVERIKEQIKILYAQREHQLWSPLEHQFLKTLTNNDYRVGLSKLNDLMSITHDDLLAWHHKYITQKRLRVVLVGDFDVASMQRDLLCIFLTLPSHAKSPVKTIEKLSFKSGINQVYDVVAKDEASLILVRYPLNYPGKVYPDHRLQILQSVVNEILRIKLREKRQATYSQSVTVMENKSSFAQNWLDIILFAKRDQAAKIRDDVKQIMAKLRVKGISQEQLNKAKEPYAAQAKKALKENSYWSLVLANNFDEATHLKWISNMETDIKAIKIHDINRLLQEYFPAKNASTAILHPIKQ